MSDKYAGNETIEAILELMKNEITSLKESIEAIEERVTRLENK